MDTITCPECGETVTVNEDPCGRTYQCTNMECLSFDEVD